MENAEEHRRQWFLWGSILTAILSVPFIIGMCIGFFNAFRGISEHKATGLGAVAGGVAEGYVMFGVILAFVLPITAIVLLIRSLSVAHRGRAVFSTVCISWNALLVALAGLSVWFLLIYLPHLQGNH